jgi:hypothetical protein
VTEFLGSRMVTPPGTATGHNGMLALLPDGQAAVVVQPVVSWWALQLAVAAWAIYGIISVVS